MAYFCLILDSGKYSDCNLGNCLRLFALQSVSAVAMRKVFDNLPGTFDDKLKTCRKRKEEITSGGYIYI